MEFITEKYWQKDTLQVGILEYDHLITWCTKSNLVYKERKKKLVKRSFDHLIDSTRIAPNKANDIVSVISKRTEGKLEGQSCLLCF